MNTAEDLRRIAAELMSLAARIEGVPARQEERTVTLTHPLSVTLPQPDLFSQMGLTTDDTMEQVDELVASVHPDSKPEPAKRTYIRVRCRMQDEAIVAANKVGRSQGYCQRSDIERSLRRTEPGRSREEIREAVNDAVAALGLTCIVYNSYRYYRRSDRKRIIDTAINMFKPMR